MKLDLELVRELLLEVEKAPANTYPEVELPERDENEVLEHLELLIEADLLEGTKHESGMGEDGRLLAVDVTRLTWEGHQFLANARNEQVWARTRAIVKEKGGAASFAVVKGLLTATALHLFGLTP
jgi:Hypothetical protein (DUF2513)